MTIQDKYRIYKEEVRKNQEEELIAAAERRNSEARERIEWFDTFVGNRFPDQTFTTEDRIYDNSTQARIGPVKGFVLNGRGFYLYPVSKGKYQLFTVSSTGGGCDNLATFDEGTKDPEIFNAILNYLGE